MRSRPSSRKLPARCSQRPPSRRQVAGRRLRLCLRPGQVDPCSSTVAIAVTLEHGSRPQGPAASELGASSCAWLAERDLLLHQRTEVSQWVAKIGRLLLFSVMTSHTCNACTVCFILSLQLATDAGSWMYAASISCTVHIWLPWAPWQSVPQLTANCKHSAHGMGSAS